jgi:hypothetical protein
MFELVVYISLSLPGKMPYFVYVNTLPVVKKSARQSKGKNEECMRLMDEVESAFRRRFPANYGHLGLTCEKIISHKVRVL